MFYQFRLDALIVIIDCLLYLKYNSIACSRRSWKTDSFLKKMKKKLK